MSAAVETHPIAGDGPSLPEAIYFGSTGHELFAWLHRPPVDASHRSAGLVICKPFGYEAICSHKSLRMMAEAAAAIGTPVLRVDYLGTGDSADIDPKANQLEIWSTDVLAAIAELQRRTGVERVCLLGIRFGALLALHAAAQCSSVVSLILISPIITGRRYLREMRATRLAASLANASDIFSDGTTQADMAADEDGIEVSGYPLSSATLAALAKIDMSLDTGLRGAHALIIDSDKMPVTRKWADALVANNNQVEYLKLPGLIEMIMAMPHDAKTPQAVLAAVIGSLEHSPRAGANFIPITSRAGIPGKVLLHLPGTEPGPDGRLAERPVFIGPDQLLFGILTEPRRGELRRRAVILVNAGATYHVGPNRSYVSLARRWAKRGYTVLRMDLAGLGESRTRPGRIDNEVFPAAALDDIRMAIDFVRQQRGINDVTLCGVCSGAYHSLRAAAAAMPVERILLVNPENFFWKEGTDLNSLELAEVVRRARLHRERIFSIAAWWRLVTGQINLLRILRIYIHRPLLALESALRNAARRVRLRLPRDLGWELEEIAARGVGIAFIFANGEAGIDLLRIQGGSSVKRLGDRCRVHIIDSADHIFSQARTRSVMEEILSEELFTEHRRLNVSTPPRSDTEPFKFSEAPSKPIEAEEPRKISALDMNVDRAQHPQVQENLSDSSSIGVVVIGRNEGERLVRCLKSLSGAARNVVYVDSGSKDDSVAAAATRGVTIVELDMSTPFTAARARNAGFDKLLEVQPGLDYVFFVDGDCEVVAGWMDMAVEFLAQNADVAVVWGRRRERHPEKSVYNMLCDIEWENFPLGETKACGGDAVARIKAIQQVHGYRADLICGEEPEMCIRLRQAGWRIWHLNTEMTLHDAAIYRFGQWWRRVVRGGYGSAQGAAIHGAPPERHWVWESRRAWMWGLCVPVITLILCTTAGWWGALFLAVYPIQMVRLARRGGRSSRENWLWAGAMVIGKFPEMLGQTKYLLDRLRHVRSRLIEYK